MGSMVYPSLLLLPGPLLHIDVVSVQVPSMGQTDLFKTFFFFNMNMNIIYAKIIFIKNNLFKL